MKNKIIVLCTLVAVLCFSFLMNTQKDSAKKERYIEHLEKETIYNNYDYSKIDATTFNSSTIDKTNFKSNLPVISFDTRGQEIKGAKDRNVKEDIQVSMEVFDKNVNTLNDKATYDTEALIRYRGNSSRFFDKLGMRIKLINKKGEDKDYPLLGLSSSSDFVLHGPWLDKTLMRNYLGYNITGQVMEYSPNVRYCEVFVNGEYLGVYLLVETIKVSKDKVNISKLNSRSNVSSYLLMIGKCPDRKEEENLSYLDNFSRYTNRIHEFSCYTVRYPTETKMTQELYDYINTDLSQFEKMLYSYDYDDENLGYLQYIDIDSFVNYVVFNEFFLNYDAGSESTYVYKDKVGKYKLAFWDMNNIFDNYFTSQIINQDFTMKNKLWFEMLLKDEYFVNRVIERYRTLRETLLSEDYLYDYIDKTIDYLGPAIERNFVKWGDSFTDEKSKYKPSTRNQNSYSESIQYLKNAIHERGVWLDQNIESLRQFSHESKVKTYNP